MTATRVHLETDATTSLRRAWWSLLGFVVTFFLAFGVGEAWPRRSATRRAATSLPSCG